MVAFSERLKLLRKEKALSQKRLGDILNIPRTTIANWESGRLPEIAAIENLADYFEVTVDYIIGRSNIRNPLNTTERIKAIIQNEPDIASFIEQLTYRDKLKIIAKILKNLPDTSIERLIKVILDIEDVSNLV